VEQAENSLWYREGDIMGTPHQPEQSPQQKPSKRFMYIHIWASKEEIRVQCTDPQSIQVLMRAIQRTYPDSQVETRKDLSDQVHSVKITNLVPEDRHQKVAWWLFKMMCERGWEPFETGEHWYKMKAYE